MVAMIPQTDLFLVLMPCLVVIFILGFYTLSLRTTAKELFVFRKARAKKLDIELMFDITTGKGEFKCLKPEDNDQQSPMLERSDPGVHLRADFCKGLITPIIVNGLRLFFYANSSSHPLGPNTAAAFKTMISHRFDDTEWEKLSFLPDRELFSLIRTPEEDLVEACNLFIQEYNPQTFELESEAVQEEDDGQN